MNAIDLWSEKEGYVSVSVSETPRVTLARLKETIAKTPFALGDVEWTVERAPKSSP